MAGVEEGEFVAEISAETPHDHQVYEYGSIIREGERFHRYVVFAAGKPGRIEILAPWTRQGQPRTKAARLVEAVKAALGPQTQVFIPFMTAFA